MIDHDAASRRVSVDYYAEPFRSGYPIPKAVAVFNLFLILLRRINSYLGG